MPISNEPNESTVLRPKLSTSLNQRTDALLRKWAREDRKPVSTMLDDVIVFANRNGFRDE